MTDMSSSELAPERRSIDQSKIAYQLHQPIGMVSDAFVGAALDLGGDEREWVPLSPTVVPATYVVVATRLSDSKSGAPNCCVNAMGEKCAHGERSEFDAEKSSRGGRPQ